MRQFISIVAASVLTFSALVTSASAGDRYYNGRDRDRAVAGAIIDDVLGSIIGGAIANSGPRYAPAPRYHQPRRHNGGYRYQPRIQHYGGGWVNKGQYERRTGRGCPGPIAYVNGTYICQLN